jgi:uncharacterized alpha-E superfamily protein
VLSRNASNLYWTGRYLERADFLARLVESTVRLAGLPTSYGGDPAAWAGALASAGVAAAYAEAFGEVTEDNAIRFLSVDERNDSSIRACLERARNNARAVRTGLSAQTWEVLNEGWQQIQKFKPKAFTRARAEELVEYAQRVVLTVDGSAHRTMLRGDAFWFMQLGAVIERADNTARILDVKYHLLLPSDEAVGGSVDYYQWATVLRTVSALTAYHWIYRETVKPWLVADFLIFNAQMPRSLAACYDEIVRMLDALSAESGRRGPADRIAAGTRRGLSGTNIASVFGAGLHEFIGEFIANNNRLGAAVAEQFLF